MKRPLTQFTNGLIRGGLRGLLLAGLFSPLASAATEPAWLSLQSTNEISLEDLVNIKVTSVSKQEQNLFDAPAAVSVLSNEDLRRSGATSVAEALRLVPGLDVAQANSSQWAVSSRGFNSIYANKLLVLVDGRAVYTSLFAGVYWDLQQPMLDDVDRIEVIRGPGATLWGANAVNGVINVVTRSARDTQGGMVYGGGGDPHQAMSGARYGGQLGDNTYYRVFGSYQLNDDYPLANGQPAGDGWQNAQGGFRLDHYPHADTHFMWEAGVTGSDLDDHASDGYNVNTVGRWTREFSGRSSLEVQAYYDRTYRNEAARSQPTTDTGDISVQHTLELGERNAVIWGGGYRFTANHVEQTSPNNVVVNGNYHRQLFNVFAQDEFKILPDKFTVTAGSKLEHNDYTGFEIQPSIRAMFKPTEHQTLWAAVSRAVRTPDDVEAGNVFDIAVGAPVVGPGGGLYTPTLVSGSNLKSEVLWAYELGYRIQPCKRVGVDIATFYNDYSDLIGFGTVTQFVPGSPGMAEMPWMNNQSGHTYGGEASVTVSPTDNWRLTASYSLLIKEIDGQSAIVVGDPQHQAMLRSSYDFTKQASLDGQIRYVGGFTGVPAYITADIRFAYRLTERLELSLVGQNLFQDRHPEQGTLPLNVTSQVPRGFYGKITWHF